MDEKYRSRQGPDRVSRRPKCDPEYEPTKANAVRWWCDRVCREVLARDAGRLRNLWLPHQRRRAHTLGPWKYRLVVCPTLLSAAPPFLSLVHRTKDPTAGYHANSIEKVFGMARSMVLLIAKVCYTALPDLVLSLAYPPTTGQLVPLPRDTRACSHIRGGTQRRRGWFVAFWKRRCAQRLHHGL